MNKNQNKNRPFNRLTGRFSTPPVSIARRLTFRMIGRLAVLSALFLFAACQETVLVEDNAQFGEAIVRLGDTPLAEVDGTKIYLSDVERAAMSQGLISPGTSLTPGTPLFSTTLDALIDQRLLALAALRQALDQRDETRRRLTLARERILGSVLVETYLAETVTDQTIRRMYDEQASLRAQGQEVRARHIVVKDESEIIDAKKRIEAGEDFATVAREVSTDRASREQGGDLGFFSNDVYSPAFTEKAYNTSIGTISEPFQTGEGWHIIRVEAKRRPTAPTFAEMRDEIEVFMTYDEIQKLLRALRSESDVKLLVGQGVDRTTDPLAQSAVTGPESGTASESQEETP